ncbi:hypothetical protein MMC27_001950 [Xylographa pallens]|nr:hypothetical protein [Xylographa pallens]
MTIKNIVLEDSPTNLSTKVEVHKVDFTQTQLPEYSNQYAVVLDNVLTAAECNQLIQAAEASTPAGWEPAMINVGGGRQMLALDTRNCGRIIWDDSEIIGKIWNRVKDHVPELQSFCNYPGLKRQETWQMTRLNERMRFLKYGAGQYFNAHCDGAYETPDKTERSFYTLHMYLNESDPEGPGGGLIGGSTEFHSMNMKRSYKVVPKIGRVLIFQHRGLLHSGEEVLSGTKCTLRTDIMYKKI